MPGIVQLRPANRFYAALALAFGCSGFEEKGFEVYIPYVPTPQYIVERMLDLAEVNHRDFLIDLGSGDGRIAITAAKKHGARALGVEIKPELVVLADRLAAEAGVTDRVTFREQDLYKTPIAEASVVTLYLPPSVNLRLRPRLLEELKPGTRVVSQSYSMGAWRADAHLDIRGIGVYLWIIPARAAGRWSVSGAGMDFSVEIDQQFQEIRGTATVGDRTVPLRDAVLRGDLIEFGIDFGGAQPERFHGRIASDMIEPDHGRSEASWRATRASNQKR
jgi:hypothetical protein